MRDFYTYIQYVHNVCTYKNLLGHTFRLYEKFEPLIANVGGINITGQRTPWTEKVQIMDILREFPSLHVSTRYISTTNIIPNR